MSSTNFFRAVAFSGLALAVALPVSAGCNPNFQPTKPASRYTDNGNGTVTDQITGLMWKQCSEGQTTVESPCDTGTAKTFRLEHAMEQVSRVNAGEGFSQYTDWRLPNKAELASLLEGRCLNPAINSQLFPNTAPSYYWSSTPLGTLAGYAWYVYFYDGYEGYSHRSFRLRARLVRVAR